MASSSASHSGGASTPVRVSGAEFANLAEAARAHGLSLSLVRQRIRKGWPIEKAFQPPKEVAPRKWTKPVAYDGKTFHSSEAVVRELGVTRHVLKRAARGATAPAQAIEKAVAVCRAAKDRLALSDEIHGRLNQLREQGSAHPFSIFDADVVVAGKTYPSLTGACEVLGKVSRQVALKRLLYGWSIEQALGLAPAPIRAGVKARPITIEGVQYPSLMHAAKHFGVRWGTLRMRLLRGQSPEEAVGIQASRSGSRIEVGGEVFATFSEMTKHFGQRSVTVRERLSRGWSLEEALGIVSRNDVAQRTPFVLTGPGGEQWRVGSLRDFAHHYGLEARMLRMLARSPDESLEWKGWRCRPATAADAQLAEWAVPR